MRRNRALRAVRLYDGGNAALQAEQVLGFSTCPHPQGLVEEASHCVLTELHGISLACEAVAAKEVDGKGAKVYGKFVRFTDPELVNKAAIQYRNLGLLTACFPMPDDYREKELILELKLPAEGMKVGLQIKKHPLFGKLDSPWQ